MDSINELVAITGKNPPAKYIHPNGVSGGQDHFLLPLIEIPVIDVSHFITPSTSTAKELDKLYSALNSVGCIMMINHGVESSLLDNVRLVFKKFLQLPKEEMLKYWSEGFQGYGRDPAITDSLVHDWSHRLRLIISPEEIREMKYWPCPTPNQVLGLKAHSDGTVITFLLQDEDVEGLQILIEDQWFRVPIIPGALVLNVGEHLEIMSNGEFKSPIHRAVVNPERNRISLAVPSIPQDDTEIEPVEGLISEGKPRLFKKVKYSRSINLHYYQSGKRIVDDARI